LNSKQNKPLPARPIAARPPARLCPPARPHFLFPKNKTNDHQKPTKQNTQKPEFSTENQDFPEAPLDTQPAIL